MGKINNSSLAKTDALTEHIYVEKSNKPGPLLKANTILGILKKGNCLSLSLQKKSINQFIGQLNNLNEAVFIGFDNGQDETIKMSTSNIRDILFKNTNTASFKNIFIISATCFMKQSNGNGPVGILKWENELGTIAAILNVTIIVIHDSCSVDPYVAMTQPFIYDETSGVLLRNYFAVPVNHLINCLGCSDDSKWLQLFQGHGILNIVDSRRRP